MCALAENLHTVSVGRINLRMYNVKNFVSYE